MKHLFLPAWLTVALLAILTFAGCSDDMPPATSEEDVLGIWTDKEGHYLDMGDTEHMDEYVKTQFDGTDFWLQRHTVYFFEPNSYLMMKEDMEGNLHVYKVISVDEKEMVICWVATPDLIDMESDSKLEIFRVFFNRDYKVDPSKYETYRRLTRQQFEAALGDTEIIES